MSDLISRNALHRIAFADSDSGEAILFLQEVDELPSVDAVEVVRCKDCSVPHNKWTGCPNLNGLVPPPNHFCSFGERKGNETD